MYFNDGWHWGAGLVMFVFMAGFWVALAVIIGSVVKRGGPTEPPDSNNSLVTHRNSREH